jgi:hypothetical protein
MRGGGSETCNRIAVLLFFLAARNPRRVFAGYVVPIMTKIMTAYSPNWTRDGSTLLSPPGGKPGIIYLENELPAEYEINSIVEGVDGQDGVCFGLIVDGHRTSVCIDMYERSMGTTCQCRRDNHSVTIDTDPSPSSDRLSILFWSTVRPGISLWGRLSTHRRSKILLTFLPMVERSGCLK